MLTARADVAGVAGVGVTAHQHTLNDLANAVALIIRDLVFEIQLTPVVSIIEEGVMEVAVASGVVRATPRRGGLIPIG